MRTEDLARLSVEERIKLWHKRDPESKRKRAETEIVNIEQDHGDYEGFLASFDFLLSIPKRGVTKEQRILRERCFRRAYNLFGVDKNRVLEVWRNALITRAEKGSQVLS